MQCLDGIKTEVKQTMHPLKQLNEKSVNKFLVKENVDLTKFIDFAIECPEFENVRSGLGKKRREDNPLLPKTQKTVDLDGQYLVTIYGQRFYFSIPKVANESLGFHLIFRWKFSHFLHSGTLTVL